MATKKISAKSRIENLCGLLSDIRRSNTFEEFSEEVQDEIDNALIDAMRDGIAF